MAENPEALWLYAHRQVSMVELSETCGLPEAVLRELVEYGVLAPADPAAAQWDFAADCVARLRRAARLRSDLELDTPALALVVGFLERIETLEEEVRDLAAQLGAARR